MGEKSLLDLSSKTTSRRHITVNEKRYELRDVREISLVSYQRIARTAHGLEALKELGTEEAEVAVERATKEIDDLIHIIVVDGESLDDVLTDVQKMQVIQVFFETAEGMRISQKTEAESSSGSPSAAPGSTAEGSATGSKPLQELPEPLAK